MPKKLSAAKYSSEEDIYIVHPSIKEYIDDLLSKHDEPVLLEMEKLARERSFPIVGRQVGVFLEILTRSIAAKKIFEFGSGFGYSSYWFARGLAANGKVICTDKSLLNFEQAKDFLKRADLWNRVAYRTGPAQASFRKTKGSFDIIYNDADKVEYPEIWMLAKDRVRPGGFYVADNCLWGGSVARIHNQDKSTMAIREHNHLVANDPSFDLFMNPTRDGVIVAMKK